MNYKNYLKLDTRKAIADEPNLMRLLAYNNMVVVQTVRNWCIGNSPMLTTIDNLATICKYFEVDKSAIIEQVEITPSYLKSA